MKCESLPKSRKMKANLSRAALLYPCLWAFSISLLFLGLSWGAGDVTLRDVFFLILHKMASFFLGIDLYAALGLESKLDFVTLEALVWELRLPRSLLCLMTGAALGCAGAMSQGLFQNPLASPDTLGFSSGAALMVIAAILLSWDEQGLWSLPLVAACGVLLALLLLYFLTRGLGDIMSLLLAGLALSMLFSAAITMLHSLTFTNYEAMRKSMQWLVGSFDAKSWEHLLWGLLALGAGLALSFPLSRQLDVLHLGKQTALSLGVHLKGTYSLAVLSIALLVGAATALVGIIAFVGLLTPHIARGIVGAKHSSLIAMSITLGALLMLIVDTVSRTFPYAYLAPGALMSCLGAPFFLWLIYKYYAGARRELG